MNPETPGLEASQGFTSGKESALPGIFLMTDSFATGGSERQFAALASALSPRRFRVHVGCIQKKGGFLPGFENATEFPVGGSLFSSQSWRTRLNLSSHLRRNRLQIAHAFDFYTNLTLVPAARFSRVPVVIASQRQLGDLLTKAKQRAQLAVFHLCDRVVCNSRASAARLIEEGIGRRKLVVIGNGLPCEAFETAPPFLPRPPGTLRVGMIARMNTPSKNHKLFLQAGARIVSRFPDLQFVMVGDGPLRPGLEKEAASLGIGAHVKFLGDRKDIPALLASLDVSVLPSDSESLSNSILESMAAGVPVIASAIGGNPELLGGERGVLVKPDAETLAQAMVCLLTDEPLRRRLAANGRRFALENFTLENMRRRHEDLYGELLLEKNWQPGSISRSLPSSVERRIGAVIVAASPRYVGGQSVQAGILNRNWQGDREVKACFIPIDPPLPKFFRQLENVPGLRTILREPIYLLNLWRGLKSADIAHIFSASYWSFLIAPLPALLFAKVHGARTLIHYHSGEARDHLQRFRTARTVLASADELVVPSGFLVEVFREFGLEARAIPNVIDLSQFSYRLRSPLRPHLLCTRGFHRYYGVDIVVRAFAEIHQVYPEARLELVGGGPLEREIRALVQDLRLTGVRFTGVLTHEEIGACYDRAHIFINASRLDNMPVSILEAFAAGTPVVTTAPEGMRHFVEDGRTGLLSEPEDSAALARNVMRVLGDPDLAHLLATNARHQAERYSWQVVRERWLDVYRSMLGSVASGVVAVPRNAKKTI